MNLKYWKNKLGKKDVFKRLTLKPGKFFGIKIIVGEGLQKDAFILKIKKFSNSLFQNVQLFSFLEMRPKSFFKASLKISNA